MVRSRAQPIKCEYFWRLASQESVILPSLERKLRKNALCLNQSAISNFALNVISSVSRQQTVPDFPTDFPLFQRHVWRNKGVKARAQKPANKMRLAAYVTPASVAVWICACDLFLFFPSTQSRPHNPQGQDLHLQKSKYSIKYSIGTSTVSLTYRTNQNTKQNYTTVVKRR